MSVTVSVVIASLWYSLQRLSKCRE